ncbi:MAG: RNA polymerase sigma factor [Candidatus Electryonea clarkiae]|nr:RNA polymerase sigma factor [Candidatus Electryonea clarkiae]MDP8288700.1 RNA polymerase sigma factor [Candidatus Electryonea clarkiae]
MLNEAGLIRKAQSGNAEAFRRLVEKHSPVIWTVINRMTLDPASAEDYFQETIIRFWKGLPSFKGESKLSTWLYKIAYRICLDGIEAGKRKSREKSLDESLEEKGIEFESIDSSGEKIENDIAARDAIEKGLNKLNPEWRTMLILYYWKGLSMLEISDITGHPVNTVKVYMHRARAQLRNILKVNGFPQE